MEMLTQENYLQGFLIDDVWIGGVSQLKDPEKPKNSGFLAYVIDYQTGESLLSATFEELPKALALINTVSKAWAYESASNCGSCAPGTCTKGTGKGACGVRC